MKFKQLKEKLPKGTVIYKSKQEGKYEVIKYKNNKLFFSIPSNNPKKDKNIKSIHIDVIRIALLNNINKLKLPFDDCRKIILREVVDFIK